MTETEAAHRAAVERALAAMRGPDGCELSLDDMAEIACLSPFHFSRVFRGCTGVPPGAFLSALRMERAKGLLLTTDAPITEVCYAVGYTSLGTFTSRFTHAVGVSPSHLRRLPETIAATFSRRSVKELLPERTVAPRGAVAGRVSALGLADSLIFIGLFPQGIPQHLPVAGTILTSPGPFRFGPVPNGRYFILSAAIPTASDPVAWLMPGADVRVGGGQVLTMEDGRLRGEPDVSLRPRRPTDPPILMAPVAVMLDQLRAAA
ncbi:MAG: helix-turn-helix transcriptional regulator [Thermomicrobiales bacterium]